jgi:hypothetical protein
MRRRKILATFLAVLLTCFGVVIAAQKAPDVHDEGVFELDGNAIHGTMVPPGDDWDNVLLGGGGLSLVNTGLITDAPSDADDNFQGGGSKDLNDVSSWGWATNSVPNKDDLLHAFAAIYRMPSDNHIHIYFGADRYSNGGDAQIGFWFFVNKISKNQDGTFSGTHAIGDILVLSDFTQGGSVPSFTVYEWVGSGGDNGALQTLITGVDCQTSPPGDTVCGRVNDSIETPTPWPFRDSSPQHDANTYYPGEFFEAGLDLTALLPNAACLSSFLAETRSSQSLSAQLEDFVLGSFDTCKITVGKSGPALSKVGDPTPYTYTVTNDGISPLYLQSVVDDKIGDLTSVAQASCGTLQPGQTCTFTASYIVQPGDPDPLINNVTVIYNTAQDFSGTQISGSASFSVNLFQPSVLIQKSGPTMALVGDNVPYTFRITNTSSSDSPDLVLASITDSVLGDLSADAAAGGCTTLAPGAFCQFTVSRPILPGDPNPLVNTVDVLYHPQGFPNDIRSQDTHSVTIVHPSLSVTKACDPYGLIGQPDHYTITVTNTGDVALEKVSLDDSLLGALSGADTLAPGASAVLTPTRVILPSDPNPLVNTVMALYQIPAGMGVSAQVSAQAACSTVILHPSISLAKTCSGFALVGGTIQYHITVTNTGDTTLEQVSFSDSLLGPLGPCTVLLPPGNSCTVDASRVVLATDPDPLPNTASAVYAIAPGYGVSAQVSASASCATDILHPSATVTKTCLTDPVPVGASANFRINVANTGDVPITIHLQDPTTGLDTTFNLGVNPAPPCGDLVNDPSNGCYMTEVSIVATGSTVFNDATVDATLDASYGIPGIVSSSSASAQCQVQQGGATRTLGFWSTHCDYTQHVFNVHLAGDMNIGWRNITNSSDLFGIFWANNAKNSDGTKRGKLCQARETVANQVLAAILNSALTNGAPLPVPLSTIQSIMSGTSVTAIRNLGATLDAYNQSGDTVAIVDGDGYSIQPANPACAKALADIPFADCP